MQEPDWAALGAAMHRWAADLQPMPRSVTGAGLRASLAYLGEQIDLTTTEVPSGERVFDWTIPDEWTQRSASIRDAAGRTVVDASDHPLTIVGYSRPYRGRLTREELAPHIHCHPDNDDWIPYRTCYYRDEWGFCLSRRRWNDLGGGPFDVVVDAELAPGGLTFAECVLPGDSTDEFLISAHSCHPFLANDNLSGMVVAAAAAQLAAGLPHRRWTYRFVFAPGTLGAIAWLARRPEAVARVRAGLVLACLGGAGPLHYKQTLGGAAAIDRAAAHLLAHRAPRGSVLPYEPFGYDERQYNSPGFQLPVGRLTRTPPGEFPEYHSSADDLSLIPPEVLADSLSAVWQIILSIEHDRYFQNLSPYGEPRLGPRGIQRIPVSNQDGTCEDRAMLWLLALGDGSRTLLDAAERSGIPFAAIDSAAERLVDCGLLRLSASPLSDARSSG